MFLLLTLKQHLLFLSCPVEALFINTKRLKHCYNMSWILNIFESSLEEPQKKFAHFFNPQREHSEEHSKSAKKTTKKPICQQQMFAVLFSFAVLLNNEDENCLINQAWIPFWRIALAPLLHMNNNSLL